MLQKSAPSTQLCQFIAAGVGDVAGQKILVQVLGPSSKDQITKLWSTTWRNILFAEKKWRSFGSSVWRKSASTATSEERESMTDEEALVTPTPEPEELDKDDVVMTPAQIAESHQIVCLQLPRRLSRKNCNLFVPWRLTCVKSAQPGSSNRHMC